MLAGLDVFVPPYYRICPDLSVVNAGLANLNNLVGERCVGSGGSSIDRKKLMGLLLLWVLCSVHGEGQRSRQMQYNLSFRRFVQLALYATMWGQSVFARTNQGLIKREDVEEFFGDAMSLADRALSLSKNCRSVGDALLWAQVSQRSFPVRDERDRKRERPGTKERSPGTRVRATAITHSSRVERNAFCLVRGKMLPQFYGPAGIR